MSLTTLVNIVISITLINMMLVVGLNLTFAQLWKVAQDTRLVLGALAANFIVFPAVTVALLAGLHAPPLVAVGFVLLALCPGAPAGPPATRIAKGNVPVAAGLMVILAGSSALVAPLLLPVLLPLISSDVPLRIDPLKLLKTLLLIQLLPLFAGLAIREWSESSAAKILRPAAILSNALGLIVVVLVGVVEYRLFSAVKPAGFAWMIVLLIASLIIGWFCGPGDHATRTAMSLTAALRNLGVALVIATSSFPHSPAVTATLVYGIVSLVGSLLVAIGWGRQATRALIACAALLVMAAPFAASAQTLPLPIPHPTASATGYGFPIKRVGSLDTAPITFEGKQLFWVAAPAPTDAKTTPLIVWRVETIEDNLRRITPVVAGPGFVRIGESRFEAATFRVAVATENGYPALFATDGKKTEALNLMTITEADVAYYGVPAPQLASEWQEILQNALSPVVRASEPSYLQAQFKKIPLAVGGAILLTILLAFARRRLRRYGDKLDAETDRIDEHGTSDTPEAKSLRTRHVVVNASLWLVSSCLLLVWILLALWLLQVFPNTRAYAYDLTNRLILVVIVWFAFVILNYALSIVIVRVSEDWGFNPFLTFRDRTRMQLRRPTIVRAVENLKVIVLVCVAVAASLSILSISTTSVLTIGAIAAFAVSFAAQSTIKDFVNGFLILSEDQFAIGDSVTINGVTGTVENLTLRITQIRAEDGKLVTIANSTINLVENATRV